jgi:O-antigen/teichoic acid export membrane protein
MNALKKLVSDTAIYGISSILGRVLNYFLVPFYTSLLLPAEYGVITEFYAYAAFLNIIYMYGMETAYFRFAAQGRPIEVFRLTISLLILTTLVFSSILVALATPIINLLHYPGQECYIYYFVGILAVDTMLAIPFAQLRLANQALHFAKAKCLQIGLNIALNLLFLYILPGIDENKFLGSFSPFITYIYTPGHHIIYIFLANLIANICVIPLLARSLVHFKFQINWKKIQPIFLYALPLLAMGLAGTINEMLSRALLKHILPIDFYPGQTKETILGIFGACYKLSIFMLLGIQAFRYAAEPLFFTHARDKHAPQLFSKIMHGYILVGCFILFAVSANLDLLGYLFLRKPEYRTSIEIVPYLSLAYLWLGIYYNLSVWFKLADKTYYGSLITIIGAGITVLLNILLVPYWGYWGSVWTTVCSYFIMAAICYYQGQKYYPIPYQIGHGLAYILGTLLLIILVRNINYAYWMYGLLSNALFTVIFGIVVYLGIRKSF